MATSKPKTGRNTTAITNPKTKSQNTTANTKNAAAGGTKALAKSGMGAQSQSKAAAAKTMTASGKSTGAKSGAGAKRSCSRNASAKPEAKSAGKTGAKMEAASDCPLKDMDIVSDVLGGQKALIKLYGTALCECDCPNLRTVLNTQLSEAAQDQFDTFLYMNERGMYPTEQAPAPKVNKAVKQFTQKSSVFDKK